MYMPRTGCMLRKAREDPKLFPLVGLQALNKQEVKTKEEL